ncbi:MAG: class I SAM-dependent DNA methyltransferase [Nannocystaceae bacterium]|nr:class I SAM-dependent methyltransferase [bacterium]
MDAWAESAAGWDDNLAVQRYAEAAHRSLMDVLQREGKALAACDVLDFGCGTGLLAAKLVPGARSIVGLDSSPAMLERFRAKIDAAGWTSVRAEAGPLPEGARFDLIVASSVLGFVPDLSATVALLASHLHEGGLVVQWDWESEPGATDGVSRDGVRAAYEAAGLEVRSVDIGFEVEVEGQTMAPLMAVGRKPVGGRS